MNLEEKVYFTPGMEVTLKLNLPNKPIMYVVDKVSFTLKDENVSSLRGIKCRWFTVNGDMQEAIFNTKDLIMV